jgi:hypothetical protein
MLIYIIVGWVALGLFVTIGQMMGFFGGLD